MPDNYAIEDWLPYRLWRLSRSAGDTLEAYYSEVFGLDGSDWRTLASLANYAPISAKALADVLDINQVQMTRALTSGISSPWLCRISSSRYWSAHSNGLPGDTSRTAWLI